MKGQWMKRSLLFVLSFGVAGMAAAMPPPERYPEFELEAATRLLLVGSEQPGAYLPKFPQCDGVNVICMDPPPFWLRVRVRSVVAGPAPEMQELAVASTSHYGMTGAGIPEKRRDKTVFLYDVRSDGQWFVMPRYAKARLFRGRDGEHYLPLVATPVWWLPCSIQEIRQEVSGIRELHDVRIPRDYWEVRQVREQPQWYVVSGENAYPRYWVSMTRLREHLAGVPAEAMQCERWQAQYSPGMPAPVTTTPSA